MPDKAQRTGPQQSPLSSAPPSASPVPHGPEAKKSIDAPTTAIIAHSHDNRRPGIDAATDPLGQQPPKIVVPQTPQTSSAQPQPSQVQHNTLTAATAPVRSVDATTVSLASGGVRAAGIDQTTQALSVRPAVTPAATPNWEMHTVLMPPVEPAPAVPPPTPTLTVERPEPPVADPPVPPIAEESAPESEESTTVTPLPKTRRGRKFVIGIAATVGGLGLLYGVDLLLSQGAVPRGVTVAGVEVGGLDLTAAEQKLRQNIEPRLSRPVIVRAGDVEASMEPRAAGLTLDWAGTVKQAGEQPLNPFTRIASFFTSREVGVATTADNDKLTSALESLRSKTDREPVEGNVRFQGVKPIAVEPQNGQKLDMPAATTAVVKDWASGKVVALPVTAAEVKATPEAVRQALENIAAPAVSGPVIVNGENKNATLTPTVIARNLTFEVAEDKSLKPKLELPAITDAIKPQLASTEKPGRDAEISLDGGKPAVRESVDGRTINWEKTLATLPEVLVRKDNRTLKATYEEQKAKLTTEDAKKLGIKEVVSEFTTGGFAGDSGRNIKRAAEQLNGAIVKPGETFSMNGRTGPRTASTGYVDAGIIDHGKPGRAIGGGVSQMATTLYNASYFAGMVDVAHKAHSYYISRYPAGREATVFQNPDGSSVIDVKFKNDTKTGILIQTLWSPSSVTVRFWGTKTFEVQSITGPRTHQTEPGTDQGPADGTCRASNGAGGFTVTDTRVIKNLSTGQIRRETQTVRYNPQNKVVCPSPPPAAG